MKHTNKNPLVSVIMPVFNSASFLASAIDSILFQTYTNFELIIVDDASTDKSRQIISQYANKDKRIKAIKNKINLGVSLSTNIGISQAKGQFIAKMDSDDISLPTRLEKQVKYLQKHTQTIAVGGQCIVISELNQIIGNKNFPLSSQLTKDMLFWAVPIQQPTIMINTYLLPKNFTWYSKSKSSAEDVDLMFRLLKFGKLENIKDYVLFYRHRPNSLSHINPKLTFKLTLQSRLNAIKNGFTPNLKAIFLNIAQILIISILPNTSINQLWTLIRGIRKINIPSSVSAYLPQPN